MAPAPAASAPPPRPRAERSEPQPFHFWLLGGGVAGLLGSAVWLAIAHFTGFSLGVFVIVLGALVGSGVRAGAKGSYGWGPGLLAAWLTLLFALGTLYVIVNWELREIGKPKETGAPIETVMIHRFAEEVHGELLADGRGGDVPEKNLMNDKLEDDFWPSTWQEAEKRWDALSPEERQERIAEYKAELKRDEAETAEAANEMTWFALLLTLLFSPLFVISMLIGAYGAFKTGSGS
ncbi:MAG: hypothetical protein M5U26_02905 [Planctomycetota bacterium]|nr:hypothetical protein [Planctomycetota bacterium]